MNKKWKLIPKIVSGKKKIESRWYVNKIAPWNRIKKGEIIYFKDSGEPITAKATVEKVLQFININNNFNDYNYKHIIEILKKYGKLIDFTNEDYESFAKQNSNKNYCILVFLKDPAYIEPFKIIKSGFGNANAWLCVDNVENIKA